MTGAPRIVPLLAKRFLLSKSSDRFLSFISWVTIMGVGLGVLALVVVTSVINGFEGELQRVITALNGDVVLYSRGNPITHPEDVVEKIKSLLPEAVGVNPTFVNELMASGPKGVAGAVLEGFDPPTLDEATQIRKSVRQGRLPDSDSEVALGEALAERLGAKIGDEVRLIAPFVGPDSESLGEGQEPHGFGTPKVLHAKVVGLIKIGMYRYDSKFIYATLGSVQKFFDLPGQVTSFKVKLAQGSRSEAASEILGKHFGYPFRAKDWGQLNKNLLIAIRLEKVVIAIILTAIVLVAAFNVVSTLMMMIHDKTKEIAILKTMGFRKKQSFGLFVWIGTGIGLVGTSMGVLAGLGVNTLIDRTKILKVPAEIYNFESLPVTNRWLEVGIIALFAFTVSFLASIYPAYRVSRKPVLEGLRYE